jgi:hypothetical protein
MVLVSHSRRFIYTKTRKTAGTSVEAYFEPYCTAEKHWTLREGRDMAVSKAGIIGFRGTHVPPGTPWYNHMPAAEVRSLLGSETWASYFKFCVVRNPFERLVSAFYFEQRPADRTAAHADAFRAWLSDGGGDRWLDRSAYTIDGDLCVDDVIRYERLAEGMERICARLGVPWEPARLPTLKSGFRPLEVPLAAYYDAEAIERVARLHAFELEHFGYAPPA